jgi:hypothetical protein
MPGRERSAIAAGRIFLQLTARTGMGRTKKLRGPKKVLGRCQKKALLLLTGAVKVGVNR